MSLQTSAQFAATLDDHPELRRNRKRIVWFSFVEHFGFLMGLVSAPLVYWAGVTGNPMFWQLLPCLLYPVMQEVSRRDLERCLDHGRRIRARLWGEWRARYDAWVESTRQALNRASVHRAVRGFLIDQARPPVRSGLVKADATLASPPEMKGWEAARA